MTDQQIIHSVTMQQGYWKGFRTAVGIFMLLVGAWILWNYILFPDKEPEPTICPEPVATTTPEPTAPISVKVTPAKPTTVTNNYYQPAPTPIVTQPQSTPTPAPVITVASQNSQDKDVCLDLADFFEDVPPAEGSNYFGCVSSYKRGLVTMVNTHSATPEEVDKLTALQALGY